MPNGQKKPKKKKVEETKGTNEQDL